MEVVHQSFRPEFINRVDELIVFHRLTKEQIRSIAEIQIGHLRSRLSERRIDLVLTDSALDWLAEHGYDPSFGARPLKRLVQKAIGDPLAIRLLEGAFADGDTITVDTDAAGLVFG